jgi:hypothetical protein
VLLALDAELSAAAAGGPREALSLSVAMRKYPLVAR